MLGLSLQSFLRLLLISSSSSKFIFCPQFFHECSVENFCLATVMYWSCLRLLNCDISQHHISAPIFCCSQTVLINLFYVDAVFTPALPIIHFLPFRLPAAQSIVLWLYLFLLFSVSFYNDQVYVEENQVIFMEMNLRQTQLKKVARHFIDE